MMVPAPQILAAVSREQAHIDRRAIVTVVPQLIKALRKGHRCPDWRNK